MESLMTGT